VKRYNPDVDPPADAWLLLDEQEHIRLVEQYHRASSADLPNPALHAVIHTIVETQLAEGIPEVRRTLERLQSEGLDRHDAIHAIGLVLANHMNALLAGGRETTNSNAAYLSALETLTAATWRAS
jgi:hypothetical protein